MHKTKVYGCSYPTVYSHAEKKHVKIEGGKIKIVVIKYVFFFLNSYKGGYPQVSFLCCIVVLQNRTLKARHTCLTLCQPKSGHSLTQKHSKLLTFCLMEDLAQETFHPL